MAVVRLGLSLTDTMSLTPRLFHRLSQAHNDKEEQRSQEFAVLLATIARNYNNKVKPDDFLPKKPQTPEQMAQEFMRATGFSRR